jgi:hypothetical protein
MKSLSAYVKLSFEEATRIIYYHYGDRTGFFKELMEDLMNTSDPCNIIAPKWYEDYKQFLEDNKKSK